jgi:beta-glucosidase/6-phospho-beta-glucosidase/beta-galactosidase
MTDKEYEWFQNNVIKAPCIMGNDYYQTNEHVVHADGIATEVGEILGYYAITNQYFRRYRLPVMHTETNKSEPHAADWLRKQWCNVYQLKQDGVPIVGFTWYSLTDQKDWDSKLTEDKGTVIELGLFDLNRNIRPVGYEYKKLIQQWKGLLADETLGMHITY